MHKIIVFLPALVPGAAAVWVPAQIRDVRDLNRRFVYVTRHGYPGKWIDRRDVRGA